KHQVGDAQCETAVTRKSNFAEPRKQLANEPRIDEAANAKRRYDDAHQAEVQAESLMQIGAHISERPEHERSLAEHRYHHDARPGAFDIPAIIGNPQIAGFFSGFRRG